VHDFATFCPAGAGIHLPALRRGLHQQDARGRTGAAHRLERRTDGGRAAGDLKAEQGIGIEPVIRRCVLDTDRAEVDLQLLGDQHRDRGVGALSHLDEGHGHGHPSARRNPDEGARRERPALGPIRRSCHGADADQQAAADGTGDAQELAPRQVHAARPGESVGDHVGLPPEASARAA
jgi:hypothetical protein